MLDYVLFHPLLLYFLVGLYALIVGSFLNVVIYRLPIMLQKNWHNQCVEYLNLDKNTFPQSQAAFNLLMPGSQCPKCQYPVKFYANIPLLSYLFLLGRCASCKQTISLRYPFIEVGSCLLAVYLTWHFGWSWQLAATLIFSWLLICLIFIDFDHQLLPDGLTLSLLWLGLIVSIWQPFCASQDAIIGAVAGYLSLWLVANLFKYFTGREGMGYGDFKLLAALGAWAGWQMLPLIILLSSIVGAIVGIGLIMFKNHARDMPIPFGPYLAVAGWVALLFGKQIVNVYTQTII